LFVVVIIGSISFSINTFYFYPLADIKIQDLSTVEIFWIL